VIAIEPGGRENQIFDFCQQKRFVWFLSEVLAKTGQKSISFCQKPKPKKLTFLIMEKFVLFNKKRLEICFFNVDQK
jgi:hypothetical protein